MFIEEKRWFKKKILYSYNFDWFICEFITIVFCYPSQKLPPCCIVFWENCQHKEFWLKLYCLVIWGFSKPAPCIFTFYYDVIFLLLFTDRLLFYCTERPVFEHHHSTYKQAINHPIFMLELKPKEKRKKENGKRYIYTYKIHHYSWISLCTFY